MATCWWRKAISRRELRYQEARRSAKRLSAADRGSRDTARRGGEPGRTRRRTGRTGDLAGAKQRYQESLEIDKRLSAADPSWQACARPEREPERSVTLVAQGDLAGAAAVPRGSDIFKRLSAADPSSATTGVV
jgi:hypothetical protein